MSHAEGSKPTISLVVLHNGNVECGCDRVDRDVVMGGADAARSEHLVVSTPKRVDRPDDRCGVIGDNPHLAQVDAVLGQDSGQVVQVLVAGASGQNLIADDQDGCGGVGHVVMLAPKGLGFAFPAALWYADQVVVVELIVCLFG